MLSKLSLPIGTLILLVAGIVACGSGAPTTIKVTGVGDVDGRPLTTGRITFLPQAVGAGESNRPATGTINEQGQYELSTFKQGDGALPGKYQVAVISNSSEPTVEEMAEKGATIISAIPGGYNSPATSGLTA